MLGFAVPAGFYAWWAAQDPNIPMTPSGFLIAILNLILCPPVLLFSSCIDCEYGTPDGLVALVFIPGVLNALLYGVIGEVVAEKILKDRH